VTELEADEDAILSALYEASGDCGFEAVLDGGRAACSIGRSGVTDIMPNSLVRWEREEG
jgi:hypothetical protein